MKQFRLRNNKNFYTVVKNRKRNALEMWVNSWKAERFHRTVGRSKRSSRLFGRWRECAEEGNERWRTWQSWMVKNMESEENSGIKKPGMVLFR